MSIEIQRKDFLLAFSELFLTPCCCMTWQIFTFKLVVCYYFMGVVNLWVLLDMLQVA